MTEGKDAYCCGRLLRCASHCLAMTRKVKDVIASPLERGNPLVVRALIADGDCFVAMLLAMTGGKEAYCCGRLLRRDAPRNDEWKKGCSKVVKYRKKLLFERIKYEENIMPKCVGINNEQYAWNDSKSYELEKTKNAKYA